MWLTNTILLGRSGKILRMLHPLITTYHYIFDLHSTRFVSWKAGSTFAQHNYAELNNTDSRWSKNSSNLNKYTFRDKGIVYLVEK